VCKLLFFVGEVAVRRASKGFYGRFGPTRIFYSLLAAARTHYGLLRAALLRQIALLSACSRRLPTNSASVPLPAQNSAFFTLLCRPLVMAYDGSLAPP